MNRFLFLLLLFAFSFNIAQTHRFIYNYKFKTDSTSIDFRTESMVLDINPNEVKYYPYFMFRNDSINKVQGSGSYGYDSDLPVLVHNRNSNKNSQFIMMSDYFRLNTEDPISWKLLSETKSSGQYLLQKATTKFGGRRWTAWFCKEVPINEGPYKFRGLPGLIFEIQDSKNNFSFSLAKSYKLDKVYDTSDFIESFMSQKPLAVSQKIINEKMLEEYNDPLKDTREAYKNNKDPENSFWVNNTKVSSLDQFKKLSDDYQKSMKKNYNPIEIDKAVHYPEK